MNKTSNFNKTSNENLHRNKTNAILDLAMDPNELQYDSRIYYNVQNETNMTLNQKK